VEVEAMEYKDYEYEYDENENGFVMESYDGTEYILDDFGERIITEDEPGIPEDIPKPDAQEPAEVSG
jgi:hypothetical protein